MIAIINEPVKEKVKRYTIMHEDAPVLEFNRETIANPDLHDDNYGLLYDSKTFEFKAVAPCYDHNVAFQEGFLGLTRTTMGNSASLPLDGLCKRSIKEHTDIAENLKTIDLSEVKACLSERQHNELAERIYNTIMWAEGVS